MKSIAISILILSATLGLLAQGSNTYFEQLRSDFQYNNDKSNQQRKKFTMTLTPDMSKPTRTFTVTGTTTATVTSTVTPPKVTVTPTPKG